MTQNIKNLITLSVAIMAGLLLSIGTHMIFNPIKIEREKQETLDVLANYFEDVTDFETNKLETLSGVEILRSIRAYDEDLGIGYLYEINYSNGFGNMHIRLTVSPKDIIESAEFIELNQTQYQPQSRDLLEKYVLQKLESNIADGAAGATSISLNDLSHMISMLGKHHDGTDKFEISLPYAEIYGVTDYNITNEETTSENNAQIIIETIEDLGTAYTVTKSGIYETGNVTEKSITVIVVLDLENNIVGVLLPVDKYNHSKGGFMSNALEFLKSYVDLNLEDIVDGSVGPTNPAISFNSRSLIEQMVLIIQGVHLS